MGKSLVESRGGGGGGGGGGLECYALGAHHHGMVVREEKVVGAGVNGLAGHSTASNNQRIKKERSDFLIFSFKLFPLSY